MTLGWPIWIAILLTFALCIAIGAINGLIVVRTGLPSFIVTLAFLFILRGFTIFFPQIIERRTIIGGIDTAAEGDWLAPLFGGEILGFVFQWLSNIGLIEVFERGNRAGEPVIDGLPMLIVWALGLVVFGHFVLTRTRFGNWIFAAGGDAQAARYVGVPVERVKISMFMFTAFCACVFATCQVMEFGSAGADRGLLKEFEAIIAVVIGGALLTGGLRLGRGRRPRRADLRRGAAGACSSRALKAASSGVFLGVILLFAVILNTYIRRIITGER